MTGRKRRAFTLVELLVVITIIGMLMALLIPAVQRARERGRQATCTNNQKQFSLAALHFESVFHYYPPYARTLKNQVNCSWVGLLTPYLEQVPIWDAMNDPNPAPQNWQKNLVFTLCPSSPPETVTPSPLAYVINTGFYLPGKPPSPDRAGPIWTNTKIPTLNGIRTGIAFDEQLDPNGAFPGYNRPPARVKQDFLSTHDGTSSTLLLSETTGYASLQTFWAVGLGMKFVEENVGMTWDGQMDTPGLGPADPCCAINACKSPSATDIPRPASNHPGGVVASFCDGHQQFLRQDIDYTVFRHLMTPDGRGLGFTTVFDPGALSP